jgi:hypothetical protein
VIPVVVGALLLVVPAARAAAQCPRQEVAAELFTGTAWSMPTPLTVDLPGAGGRTRIDARYSTRPFQDAPYYSYRVGVARADGRAVELEMMHHKLYLENPSGPVERFEVTHGYNLPTVNFSVPSGEWRARFGVGLVVAHPEGSIGGREIAGEPTVLGGGYHIAGFTTQLGFGRRYALGAGETAMTAAPEVKVTASWARIGVPAGTVTVPNVAVHLLGGVGVRRCS